MGSFGRYLWDKGVLARAPLEEATQVMVVFGGRLGTILVEAGHLTLEEVEQHLSAHLDLPCAPAERLARPDPDALETVSCDIARRHSAFPMWIEKRTLHVAMLDPQAPDRVDELAFSTGLAIQPYVIAERRLVELLDRHYGIRPDPRFTDPRILELAGHCRPPRERDEDSAGRAAASQRDTALRAESDQLERARKVFGIAPLDAGEELSTPDALDSSPANAVAEGYEAIDLTEKVAASPESAQEGTPRLPAETSDSDRSRDRMLAASPGEIARLESQMALLADRDALSGLALRIASCFVCRAALFVVRDGMIQGIAAAGAKTDRIDGIYLPVASDHLLARAARTASPYRSPPAREGIDASLVRMLADEPPREAAALPISVGDRVVNLLYVDNGADALAETALGALEALCDIMTAAYERIILEAKRAHF